MKKITANSDFIGKVNNYQMWYEKSNLIVRDPTSGKSTSTVVDANTDFTKIARDLSSKLQNR